jgi:prepilin-type N-terminal cleavage/methylation domain-containing protein
MNKMSPNPHTSGFTLIEILIATVLMAILGLTVSSLSVNISTSTELLRHERAAEENRLIGESLKTVASQSNNGRLPTPYTNAAQHNTNAPLNLNPTSADPTGIATLQTIQQSGLGLERINYDGYASERVRVYQNISLSENTPFFGAFGETVKITYDYGVIYQTSCPLKDSTCNPSPTTGIPGDSAVLTTNNYKTWQISGNDLRPYIFSTHALQRQWVKQTATNLLAVRNALQSFFSASQLSAPPGDTTNFYPVPDIAGSPDMSGNDPITNDGCRNGWYNLNAATVNILSKLNLTPVTFYGQSAFGGTIQYCSDYDPANTSANTTPHGAALRLSRDITSAASPSNGTSLILSF